VPAVTYEVNEIRRLERKIIALTKRVADLEKDSHPPALASVPTTDDLNRVLRAIYERLERLETRIP